MNARKYDEQVRVLAALEPYGFHMGKYGDVPFHMVEVGLCDADTDFGARYNVVVGGRGMGWVYCHTDGGIEVRLDLAGWLNPKPPAMFARRVQLGTVQMPANPVLSWADINIPRFKAIDRAIERSK